MATKTTTSEIKNVVPEYDPEEMVDIKLSKDAKNYKDPVFVGVNGRTYLVERGVTVSLPRMVAEVIERSEAQKQKAEAFISDVVSRSQSI